MIPAKKTFASRAAQSGLMTLPSDGLYSNIAANAMIQFNAAEILSIEYNRLCYDYHSEGSKKAAARITLRSKGDTITLWNNDWPDGTAEALEKMYKMATSGYHVDIRDIMKATPKAAPAPVLIPAPGASGIYF